MSCIYHIPCDSWSSQWDFQASSYGWRALFTHTALITLSSRHSVRTEAVKESPVALYRVHLSYSLAALKTVFVLFLLATSFGMIHWEEWQSHWFSHDSPLSFSEVPCQRTRSWANAMQPSLKQKQRHDIGRYSPWGCTQTLPCVITTCHSVRLHWCLHTTNCNFDTYLIANNLFQQNHTHHFYQGKGKNNLPLQCVLITMTHSKNYGPFAIGIWWLVTEFNV